MATNGNGDDPVRTVWVANRFRGTYSNTSLLSKKCFYGDSDQAMKAAMEHYFFGVVEVPPSGTDRLRTLMKVGF